MTDTTERDPLQDHLIKVQKALVDSFDRQYFSLKKLIDDKDHDLNLVANDKKELGIALYKTKSQLESMQNAFFELKEKWQHEAQDSLTSKQYSKDLEKELQVADQTNQELAAELIVKRAEWQTLQRKNKDLMDLSIAYSYDIKLQRRVEEKMKFDLDKIEEQKKLMQNEMKSLQIKLERVKWILSNDEILEQKRKALNLQSAQIGETRAAQVVVDNLTQEIKQLQKLNDSVVKQWEEGLLAMRNRDVTVNKLKESLNTQKSEINENRIEIQNYKQENVDLNFRNKQIEEENETLKKDINELNSELIQIKKQNDTLEKEKEISIKNENVIMKELEKYQTRDRKKEGEIGQRQVTIDELKDSIQQIHSTYKFSRANEIQKAINSSAEEVEKEIVNRMKKLILNERDNCNKATEKMILSNKEVMILKDKIIHLESENERLSRQYKDMDNHFSSLYEQTIKLSHQLDFKDHEIDKLKDKLSSVNVDHIKHLFNVELDKMQKESNRAKEEYDKLKKMWLESQNNSIKNEKLIEKLKVENFELQQSKVKQKEIEKANDNKDYEINQLLLEIKRMEPKLKEYQNKNIELEKSLIEADAEKKKLQIDMITSVNMLKAEIKRLSKTHKNDTSEKDLNCMEKKLRLSKEIMLKAKAQLRISALQDKQSTIHSDFEKINLSLINRKALKHSNPSLINLPEKDHLLNENQVFRHHIKELTDKLKLTEKNFNEVNQKLSKKEVEVDKAEKSLKVMTIRVSRAEKMAASIERQLKQVKPNYKIDYQWIPEAEPTTQLLAAFLPRANDEYNFQDFNENRHGSKQKLASREKLSSIENGPRSIMENGSQGQLIK
ncbi:hypothetical protein O9G_001857 [Rozella allomycis CSF55]|uniref:Uncharacterized protein n=1 Tax=Rozella allomycis (strain CSF55) TaxID=988480 RepID=A0A075B0C5_ROZAC|nr:hypothetical protein O9G_001857 [Rozella allomycis CSF55]|eukprot:EPZ34244.1 hypothetical protein O9G_001857 [Rozella allomycis CSF55]